MTRTARILWVAVAEARGHLMRAHRARVLLATVGIDVDVATTNDAGVRFLAGLGTPSTMLGRGFSLAFDTRQNMSRSGTSRRLLSYLVSRGPSDVARLRRRADDYDLIVDDSFHPAAFVAPLFFSSASLPVVHVYGRTLFDAFAEHHSARLYGRAVRSLCRRSFARIEHGLSGPYGAHGSTTRLPPLLDAPGPGREVVRAALGVRERLIVAYLNPHFSDPAIADAIEAAADGATLYAVGEGYADRPGWRASDAFLGDKIAAADAVISAPGMATLSAVQTHGVPYVGLLSRQAEQQKNYLDFAKTHPASAVDVGEPAELVAALASLPVQNHRRGDATKRIVRGRAAWSDTMSALVDRIRIKKEHAPCWNPNDLLTASPPRKAG